MDWLEDELRQALRRKDPSPDFEARVMAAARRRPVLTMPRWLAAAAALLVITSAGLGYRYHRGQAAKAQVMTAMRLTGSKLSRIQMQIKAARP